MEATVGDHYRIEVRQGSLLPGLFSRRGRSRIEVPGPQRPTTPGSARAAKRARGGTVAIIDAGGEAVWSRPCRSPHERNELVRLIETQVFTARLQDFEHWLRTEGRDGGGLGR